MLAENGVRYSFGSVSFTEDIPKISIDAEKAKALIDSKGWAEGYSKDIYFIWVSTVIVYHGKIELQYFMCPRAKYMTIGHRDIMLFKPISIEELVSIL